MKRIKIVLIALAVTFITVLAPKAWANEFHFSVNPVIPENQADKVSYFDLLMDKGATQTITVQLANTTDKTVVVEESIASATTNINGVVEYSPNEIKPDATLKYNLKDYVKAPSEITLKPNTSQDVNLEVSMPNADFQGQIAGGITYQEKTTDSSSSSKKSEGLSIQNKYAYVVGLVIQQSTTKVAPDLKLNQVEPGQVNYRNVINANLQNPKAGYLNQMYAQAEVSGLTDKSLSYKSSKEMMQMAPNTNFDYPVPLGDGQKLKPGKYRLTMTVYGQKDTAGKYSMVDAEGKTQHFDYKWQFTRDFEISATLANTLNAKDVTVKHEKGFNWWLLIGIILIVLALLWLFFILWKRRKKDDEEEEDKEKAELQAKLAALEAELKEKETKKSETEND